MIDVQELDRAISIVDEARLRHIKRQAKTRNKSVKAWHEDRINEFIETVAMLRRLRLQMTGSTGMEPDAEVPPVPDAPVSESRETPSTEKNESSSSNVDA